MSWCGEPLTDRWELLQRSVSLHSIDRDRTKWSALICQSALSNSIKSLWEKEYRRDLVMLLRATRLHSNSYDFGSDMKMFRQSLISKLMIQHSNSCQLHLTKAITSITKLSGLYNGIGDLNSIHFSKGLLCYQNRKFLTNIERQHRVCCFSSV